MECLKTGRPCNAIKFQILQIITVRYPKCSLWCETTSIFPILLPILVRLVCWSGYSLYMFVTEGLLFLLWRGAQTVGHSYILNLNN